VPRASDRLAPLALALAATGASDKDIAAGLTVSVRTVRSHLENIYRKLDIHSRRDLMTRGDAAGD